MIAEPSPAGRNPGAPFDLAGIRRFSISAARVKERTARAEKIRLPTGEEGQAELLRILASIDLTTLSGDDTVATVRRLCRTARSPLSGVLKKQLGKELGGTRVAAVCVFPAFVPTAREALQGTEIPVATVAAGFPHGLSTLDQRVGEVAAAAAAGADEIDVVIRREWPLSGEWEKLHEEIRAFSQAAGDAHLKVILATGELKGLNQVGRAALTALLAGADFVKTSTGKEKVNATLPVGLAMLEALKRYRKETGRLCGLKPAGGIRTAEEAYRWLRVVQEELGEGASEPQHFRIGASSLLGDVLENLRP